MRIGVDLDGVLFDFYASFMAYVRSTVPGMPDAELVDGEPRRWHFYRDWQWTDDEFRELYRDGVDAGVILRGPARPGAVTAVRRLVEAGHSVHIVTNRVAVDPEGAITAAWLRNVGMPYQNLVITADKGAAVVEYGLDVFIDDLPQNVRDVEEAGAAGYLLDRPWNRGDEHAGLFVRMPTLEAFVHLLTADDPNERAVFGECECCRPMPASTAQKLARMIEDDLGGEVRLTSSTGGQKGSKLARFDLIPARPLWLLAEHYGRGAAKYDDNQWRKGYEWGLSYAAMQRHANAWLGGEDIDPETGSPHMAAVAWHAFALLEYAETYPEHDNRYRR